MNRKKTFEAPTVLRQVPLELEEPILGPSVVYNTDVISMGQAVDNYDFNVEGGSYTAEWE